MLDPAEVVSQARKRGWEEEKSKLKAGSLRVGLDIPGGTAEGVENLVDVVDGEIGARLDDGGASLDHFVGDGSAGE
jgi:hypothetical protein